ncbi:MAG: undecaprenyl/decaprenyl-phosphate alpha-N-acetylglucosaminyl 1-phosphate transferase [Bacteroidia bacterium]|nr:undecaprenyl/decaprenyl-phosphate alpha-N-acetylglucosaminyl 1-phosphate transferase [Bacteroidia bacterium]
MKFLMVFCVVFVLVYLTFPYIIRLAHKLGIVDLPTKRKDHTKPIPILGSFGLFLGYIIGIIVSILFFEDTLGLKDWVVFGTTFMVLIIGWIDDFQKSRGKEFPPFPKFIVQVSAAIIVAVIGVRFKGFVIPFSQIYFEIPYLLQILITVTWIFGVTTVMNFTDGMDGLASGIAAISGLTFFLIAIDNQNYSTATLAITIVASALAFLQFNKHPAKIYMGDAGATFLGFLLAIIAIEATLQNKPSFTYLFIPILAISVPILDNIYVVLIRIYNKKPIYIADAGQIHHRLRRNGMPVKHVVLFLYLISIIFSLIAVIMHLLHV